MATMVLTTVGSVIGGPLGGAIGGLIGNAIDHGVLFRPKGRSGARLADLQVQASTYGAQVPRIHGAMRVAGTVIWATDLKEHRAKSGGGKGRPSVTTFTYSVSFAVALSTRAIGSIGRIWADGNLLRGAAGDFKAELGAFRVHRGTEGQEVDPLIAADVGMAAAPAHRGMAYAMFEDLALADYGNRIPSLTFEVFTDDRPVDVGAVAADLSGGQITGAVPMPQVDGFVAAGADVGEAIGPLIDAHDLALRSDGAGVRMVPITDATDAVVAADLLARRVNGRTIAPVERSGGAADAVPVAFSLRYYDPARDYQAGVQRVVRPGAGRQEQGGDLPASMDADTARSIAALRLGRAWTGRATMTLRCGWRALALTPGMIVTVADAPGRWRIEEREWEAMAVRLALRRVPGGHGGLARWRVFGAGGAGGGRPPRRHHPDAGGPAPGARRGGGAAVDRRGGERRGRVAQCGAVCAERRGRCGAGGA